MALPGVTGPTLAPKSPACGMALPDFEMRAAHLYDELNNLKGNYNRIADISGQMLNFKNKKVLT